MLLVIDIGNTNIVFGIYKDDQPINSWRISSETSKTSDEYGMVFLNILAHNKIRPEDIHGAIISSVVPKLSHTIPKVCTNFFSVEALEVGVGTKTGINIKYDNPKEVGSDRIVNAVAAHEIYKGPAIIVDMGTAISFDVIDEKGSYLGGAISPGIESAANSLFMKASRLPKVELEVPKRVIGKTTNESLKSGIVLGYISLIDGLIERISEEMELNIEDIQVIATGGFTRLILENSKYIQHIDNELTLKGLKIIYDKNK